MKSAISGCISTSRAKALDAHENVLRKWVRELGADPAQAFPGHEQMKPEQQEIERVRRAHQYRQPDDGLRTRLSRFPFRILRLALLASCAPFLVRKGLSASIVERYCANGNLKSCCRTGGGLDPRDMSPS